MDYTITINKDTIEAVSPEGEAATMKLAELLDRMGRSTTDTGNVALPAGVRFIKTRGGVTVWVHETSPRVWNLKWISSTSPAPFGGAEYRNVTVAMPYIVVLAVFLSGGRRGQRTLSNVNECFFRTSPLTSYADDQLLVPALLNCSLFAPVNGKEKIGVDGRPLVWICTQYLDRGPITKETNADRRAAKGLDVLLQSLMETGFNYSSEHHEFNSGFSESISIDRRVASIEAWQKATEKDADFVLSVPWHPTGHTVESAVERVFTNNRAARSTLGKAIDVARLVFRHGVRRDKT